jgi:penicillin-binding protein 1A
MRRKQKINLKRRGKRVKPYFLGFIFLTALVLLSTYILFWYFTYDLPDLTKITGYKPRLISEVYSVDGQLIGEFTTEKRKLIPLEQIPTHVRNAFIAVEDKRFFKHEGVDFKRVIGALVKNIQERDIVQGGSTITQQVAKNLVLSPERSLTRKIKEAILAYRMEKNLSKDEILYIYLNHIYLGDGTYGVEAASRNYFHKSVRDINLAEAALLAGLPKRPEYYSPRKYPDRAIDRQRLVLRIMEEENLITTEQRKEAENYKIKILPSRTPNPQVAPYLVELVRQHIERRFGTKALINGGYTVFTTVDVDLSLAAQWSLRRGILELESRRGRGTVVRHLDSQKEISNFLESQKIDEIKPGNSYQAVVTEVSNTGISPSVFKASLAMGKWPGQLRFGVSKPLGKPVEGLSFPLSKNYAPLNGYGGISLVQTKLRVGDVVKVRVIREVEGIYEVSLYYDPETQGALLAMDTNGYIKALVGGFDFRDSQFNRSTQALRQPGSSFKPLVYSAAIDKGYTETTIVYDVPVTVKNWEPQNYDGGYLGPILLREALAKSRNLASVRLLLEIDPNYALGYIKQFGFTSTLNPYPSLVLGGSEVSLIEMVRAFNVFATGGKLVEPKFILRIYDRDGKLVEDTTNNQFLSSEEAEREDRETKRLQIIKEIARRIGRDVRTEDEYVKEDVLAPDEDFNTTKDKVFLPPQEFLKRLRNNSISFRYDSGKQAISPETAFIMTDLLQAVVKEGTGRRALELTSLAPVAGKTGTTNDFTDAWFIGFSPRIVTGVWVGKDNHTTLGKGEAGGRAALPIWTDFMREALKKFPGGEFQTPDGIRFVSTPYGLIPYDVDTVGDDGLYSEEIPQEVHRYQSMTEQREWEEEDSVSEIDFLIRR